MLRTSNPALNDKVFHGARPGDGAMTLNGTVNRTAILLALSLLTAIITWDMAYRPDIAIGAPAGAHPLTVPFTIGGAIAGLVFALICIFRQTAAPLVAPLYALAEGLFLGGVSAFMEMRYPGIVLQGVMLTFGTLFALLVAYRSGLIKVTEKFRLGVFAATGAIFVVYLFNFVLQLFGVSGMGFIHEGGPIGIGFSLVVVVIAALNLVLDFDFIEKGVAAGAPRYMEWFAAFGLMVTLVWLYVEFLRLLAKLRE